MKSRFLLCTFAMSFLLSGCVAGIVRAAATSTPTTSASGQPIVYQPVTPESQQQVVTQYVPVALPGQMMPTPPANAPASSQLTATAAVDAANQQATQIPNSSQFFNSMMTYDYMPGALYTVYSAPMRITDIALDPGETLISEAAGDTLRWQIAQTYSGSGSMLTQHILIKPSQSGLQNTMVITTDQHVYHLILQSTDSSYMASVQWNYPGDMVNNYQNGSGGGAGSLTPPPDSNPDVDLSNLDFGYTMSMVKGSQPPWYPVRIFNDGNQTFIQLPPNYSPAQLPVLYVADENGNFASMVNWRYRSPYIIVDVIFQTARLQSGVDSTGQTIVEINHNSSSANN